MLLASSPSAASASALPFLTQASAPLTAQIVVTNELGERSTTSIPAERALTIYIDKNELVTLMTLGACPEWLVLGYLRNQRLVNSAAEIESITVDWEVGVAAVKTRHGIERLQERTAKRVVTTGCGQGSVFGDLMTDIEQIKLPATTLTQAQLYGIVNAIRLKESTYKSAGSVHACALFHLDQMHLFVEDVGRHNAIDTIAGWMWLQAAASSGGAAPGSSMDALGKVFYTTGRLTSEMVIKSAQMGVAVVISRSGITQMGHQLAQQLGLCAIGRATNKRFLCYSAPERLHMQTELAGNPTAASA